MLYAYTILVLSSVVAAVSLGAIVFAMASPERVVVRKTGVTYSGVLLSHTSGERQYSDEYVKPSAGVRWFAVACTAIFLFAVALFCFRSIRVTQTGVVFPVERLAEMLAAPVMDRRPVLLGKLPVADDVLQDIALSLTPARDGWHIEISGNVPDIHDAFVAPSGPFLQCEEIRPHAYDTRCFEVFSTDVLADCNWILREYFRYPDGLMMVVGVRDGKAFSWRPDGAAMS